MSLYSDQEMSELVSMLKESRDLEEQGDILQYMVLTKDDKVRWSRLENLLQSASSAGAGGVSSWDMERTAQLFGSRLLGIVFVRPCALAYTIAY